MKLFFEVSNSLSMRFLLTNRFLILNNIEGYSDDIIENERELVYKFCVASLSDKYCNRDAPLMQ